jgi:hypothetical protein
MKFTSLQNGKSPTREEVRRALNLIGNWEEEEIADLISRRWEEECVASMIKI